MTPADNPHSDSNFTPDNATPATSAPGDALPGDSLPGETLRDEITTAADSHAAQFPGEDSEFGNDFDREQAELKRPRRERKPKGQIIDSDRDRPVRARGSNRRGQQTDDAETEDDADESGSTLIRLQRLLAMAGVDSRRKCEEYILTGRVTVDGKPATELGARVDPQKQKVLLDGERVRTERRVYYMLNKPSGVLCTAADPMGRTRVIDLFPRSEQRLFPVGRLDENSRGLLIVTNDGDLAERLAHPRYRIPKIYRVLVDGVLSRETTMQLKKGLYFSDGRFQADDVKFIKRQGTGSVLDITLTEGQNREIRRLLARVGHKVLRLDRIALGPLNIGDLPIGAYRPLTSVELKKLLATIDAAEAVAKKSQRTKKRPSATAASAAKATAQESAAGKIGPGKTGPRKTVAGKSAPGKSVPGKRPAGKRPPGARSTGDRRPTGDRPLGKKPVGKLPSARSTPRKFAGADPIASGRDGQNISDRKPFKPGENSNRGKTGQTGGIRSGGIPREIDRDGGGAATPGAVHPRFRKSATGKSKPRRRDDDHVYEE